MVASDPNGKFELDYYANGYAVSHPFPWEFPILLPLLPEDEN